MENISGGHVFDQRSSIVRQSSLQDVSIHDRLFRRSIQGDSQIFKITNRPHFFKFPSLGVVGRRRHWQNPRVFTQLRTVKNTKNVDAIRNRIEIYIKT